MSERAAPAPARQAAAPQPGSKPGLRLQRKCACGRHTVGGAECSECGKKRSTLQRWSVDRPSPAALLRDEPAARDESADAGPRERDFIRLDVGPDARRTAGTLGWLAGALGTAVADGERASAASKAARRRRDSSGESRGRPAESTPATHDPAVDGGWSHLPPAAVLESPASSGSGAAAEASSPGSLTTPVPASTSSAPAAPVAPAATTAAPARPAARSASIEQAGEERREAEEPEHEEECIAAPPPRSFLVDDGVEHPLPGQMGRTEFLARLQAEVTRSAEEVLEGTGRSTDGCPYLRFWFAYYQRQGTRHVERALHRYAPEAARARSAAGYIPLVAARVRRGVEHWARTGQITGTPVDLPGGAPPSIRVRRAGVSTSTTRIFGPVQLKALDGGGRAADDPEAVQAELGGGRPLDSGVRRRMEGALGRGLEGVRLHTGATAARLASRQNARAFAVGRHVAFGAGQYQPGTPMGDALIAHEMAHVVQQQGSDGTVAPLETGSARYDALESDADRAAAGVVASLWGRAGNAAEKAARNAVPALRSGLRLQRCGTFSERSSERYRGYDASTDPESLVVPVGERRAVGVRKKPELTFASLDTGVATVDATTPGDGITVEGAGHGYTFIEAREGATVRERLSVAAKHERQVSVDYHFMHDSAGHATTRAPASAAGLTARLNEVWQRQANVRFVQGTVDSPTVPQDLGAMVTGSTNQAPEWRAVTAFATGAAYNVFLVWEFELIENSGDTTADAGTAGAGGETLLDDDTCDEYTLAHEAGHHLGLYNNGTLHPADGVMAPCGATNPQRVTRAEADAVNP